MYPSRCRSRGVIELMLLSVVTERAKMRRTSGMGAFCKPSRKRPLVAPICRGPVCTLLVYVDDATSRLMELCFAEVESTFDYFRATRRYLERHGKPMAFYSDRLSVFHVQARDHAQGGPG